MRRLAQLVIIVALPAFLLLTNVRLLMTSAFLRYEYGRAGFPAAERFTPAQRMDIAEATLAYMRGRITQETLRNLRAGSHRFLYRVKELKHLVDVKELTAQAFTVHVLAGILLVVAAFLLSRQEGDQNRIYRYLLHGSAATVAVGIAAIILISLSFDWFFVRFHLTFFEGNSWTFSESDTLIQVFPYMFWFDATRSLLLLTMGEVFLLTQIVAPGPHRESARKFVISTWQMPRKWFYYILACVLRWLRQTRRESNGK